MGLFYSMKHLLSSLNFRAPFQIELNAFAQPQRTDISLFFQISSLPSSFSRWSSLVDSTLESPLDPSSSLRPPSPIQWPCHRTPLLTEASLPKNASSRIVRLHPPPPSPSTHPSFRASTTMLAIPRSGRLAIRYAENIRGDLFSSVDPGVIVRVLYFIYLFL